MKNAPEMMSSTKTEANSTTSLHNDNDRLRDKLNTMELIQVTKLGFTFVHTPKIRFYNNPRNLKSLN